MILIVFVLVIISIVANCFTNDISFQMGSFIFNIFFITLIIAAVFICVPSAYKTPRPFSISTLLYRSYIYTFNLSLYYIYYLSLVVLKYEKEKAESLIDNVFKIKYHYSHQFYFIEPSLNERRNIANHPITFLLSCMKINFNTTSESHESIDIDSVLDKYDEKKIIKDLKRPYIMLHCMNILFLILDIVSILVFVFIK